MPDSEKSMSIIDQACLVYNENFSSETYFERAVFISWYCAKPTCRFCYMYTIRDQIKKPRKARRRVESILAETIVAKVCNWKIGFLSGGIASWSTIELLPVLKGMSDIMGEKIWLNLGTLKKSQLEKLKGYVLGVTGTVECLNFDIRDSIVPDKPLEKIEEMFSIADELGMKKSITIIIGLGETEKDFANLAGLVRRWKVDRINFYRLVPHEGSDFSKGPETEYYSWWIAKTRVEFPEIDIVAGSWPDRTKEIPVLLKAGANTITKLPAIKYFGKTPAREIVDGAKQAGREMKSCLVTYPKADIEEILGKIDEQYRDLTREKYLKYYRKLKQWEG